MNPSQRKWIIPLVCIWKWLKIYWNVNSTNIFFWYISVKYLPIELELFICFIQNLDQIIILKHIDPHPPPDEYISPIDGVRATIFWNMLGFSSWNSATVWQILAQSEYSTLQNHLWIWLLYPVVYLIFDVYSTWNLWHNMNILLNSLVEKCFNTVNTHIQASTS